MAVFIIITITIILILVHSLFHDDINSSFIARAEVAGVMNGWEKEWWF